MGNQSKSVIQAMDRNTFVLGRGLDRILAVLSGNGGEGGGYEYPAIANGPIEQVLAFNNNETITLKGPNKSPHFSSHGVLTDLQHRVIEGSKVETTFPVDPATFPQTSLFPPEQLPPWDGPPVDPENTTGNGYSKQSYWFPDGSRLTTVGPSLPKIASTANGGAQFWVGSIGVVSQGTGRFEGARGVSVYVGSAYFDAWPANFVEQVAILRKGFKALVGTYFKVVLAKDLPK
jgi:hypothetical protein